MGANVHNQLQEISKNFVFFSEKSNETNCELEVLQSKKGTTTGGDEVCQTTGDLGLDWSKLVSIIKDMEMDERGHARPLQIHCLIPQQALCCKGA